MPAIDRSPIKYNHDEECHNTLTFDQNKMIKNHDSLKEPSYISTGSTVAIQHEDSGSWNHGTIVMRADINISDCSYKM